jgi:hypothetical protein
MRKQEKNEIKEANDFETQTTRASNNIEKKVPGGDEEKKVIARGSQDALYLWKPLALVGHDLHSLPPRPPL